MTRRRRKAVESENRRRRVNRIFLPQQQHPRINVRVVSVCIVPVSSHPHPNSSPAVNVRCVLCPGRALKRWKKRWCVLQDCYLFTYADERGYINTFNQPTERIDLRLHPTCQLTPGATHRFPKLTFELKGADTFPLAALKEKDRDEWVAAIQRQTQLAQSAGK